MNNSIPYQDWIQIIESEYLSDFIKDGGSAIKFAVPTDGGARSSLFSNLIRRAKGLDYLTAEVDSSKTKVHLAHELFFSVAAQIDWQALAHQVLMEIIKDSGYGTPDHGDGTFLDRISLSSGMDQMLIRSEMNRKLTERVFRHPRLAKDFRVAMVNLCLAELLGGEDGENTVRVLTDWLTGQNRRIGAVKRYEIFNIINRTNARYMFESLLNWIRLSGHSGLLVLLDTSRVTLSRNPRDGLLYYTRAAVLDSYEVLRQFIDSIDRLPGCLIIVSPDVEFLSEETGDRGFGAYEALKFRVFDEIRDRRLVNPMSSLVRLTSHT